MKVFLADASPFGYGRLVNFLSGLQGLEILGHGSEGPGISTMIEAVRPDVIILDIDMPGRSGIGFLKQLKGSLPNTVVIVLTNASSPQYRKRCTELGAEFFFDKSTEFRKVRDVLATMLQKQSTSLRSNS